MSKGHGQRKYLQLLLTPNRGQLFIDHAKKLDIKPAALARDIIYEYLSENIDESSYSEAKDSDENIWQQSVQNRLEGRALSKLLKSIRSK